MKKLGVLADAVNKSAGRKEETRSMQQRYGCLDLEQDGLEACHAKQAIGDALHTSSITRQ